MKRQRGRNRGGGGGASNGGGGKPQQNVNRAFDSNGPDNVKIRGHAQHVFEKYQQLARDSFSSGDRVLAENYLQHADHYFRILRTLQPQRPPSEILGRDVFASGLDIDFEDEGEGFEDGGGESQAGDAGAEANGAEGGRGDWNRGESRYEGNRQDDRQGDRQQNDRQNGRQDNPGRSEGAYRQDNPARQDWQTRQDNPGRYEGPRRDNGYEGGRQEGREQRREGQDSRFDNRRDNNRRFDNRRDREFRDERPYRNEGRNAEGRNGEGRAAEARGGEDDFRTTQPSDALAVIEPRPRVDVQTPPATVEAEGGSVLRSQDGGVSEAPAFLQTAAAAADESGEARRLRPRRRRPRALEGEGEEAGPSSASEVAEDA